MEEDDLVKMTIRGGKLIVLPARPRLVSPEEFERALDAVVEKRRGVLKKLAGA